MWMILGRLLLAAVIRNKQNIMLSAFIRITEPVYRLIRSLMPFAKESWIPFLAILVILIIRFMMILFLTPAMQGE
jgi:uncharacterized membrane protein